MEWVKEDVHNYSNQVSCHSKIIRQCYKCNFTTAQSSACSFLMQSERYFRTSATYIFFHFRTSFSEKVANNGYKIRNSYLHQETFDIQQLQAIIQLSYHILILNGNGIEYGMLATLKSGGRRGGGGGGGEACWRVFPPPAPLHVWLGGFPVNSPPPPLHSIYACIT